MNMVGLWLTVSLAVFSGLTMFSIYKNCDPLSNGDVSTPDQVITAATVVYATITTMACSYLPIFGFRNKDAFRVELDMRGTSSCSSS